MHVLLVDLGRELRGGQLQVYYLARALAARGDITPLVACPRSGALAALLLAEGLPVLPLSGRSPLNPAVLFSVERALRKNKTRIIHTHDATAAGLGAFFKALHGEKLLLVHSRRVSYPLRAGLRLKKYQMADAVVGVSREISDGVEKAGIAPDKVSTIHSGIDPRRYESKMERHDGRNVFLSIGAFTQQKGYSILIQAMSVLREMEDLPPWEVRIVGDGPLFSQILDEAVSLGVESHLALLGRQDGRAILPHSDVLIVPSVDGEGSSATIKEGWVTGLPVICSSLPSNTELVTDKVSGLVVPVGNPLALAAAMARCLTEPALRQRLADQGRERMRLFTDLRMAEAYVDLYRRLDAGQLNTDEASPAPNDSGPEHSGPEDFGADGEAPVQTEDAPPAHSCPGSTTERE